jgi:hypothetical protein
MNKKSLILLAILLGGLLTPQETKPAPPVIFFIASAFVLTYTATALVEVTKTVQNGFSPSEKELDYIKHSEMVGYYSAALKINTKTEKLLETEIKEKNFENFLKYIEQKAQPFERKRGVKISVNLCIETLSGTRKLLKNINIRKYSVRSLKNRIKNRLRGEKSSKLFLAVGAIPYAVLLWPVTFGWMLVSHWR